MLSSFLRSSSFWGHLNFWSRLHVWGCLHFWSCLYFEVVLFSWSSSFLRSSLFWGHLHTASMQSFISLHDLDVRFKFSLQTYSEVPPAVLAKNFHEDPCTRQNRVCTHLYGFVCVYPLCALMRAHIFMNCKILDFHNNLHVFKFWWVIRTNFCTIMIWIFTCFTTL